VTDPHFAERIHIEFRAAMQPGWMERAACAGQPAASFFTDEVADVEPLPFAETVYDAMRVCSDCPVIADCISYAYESERPMSLLDPWVDGTDADDDRFGIYGVPGRIRE